jgi:hypothetical protein
VIVDIDTHFEAGAGWLEAWGVELPKPATWGRLVERSLGSLER